MKKYICLILIFSLCLGMLCACVEEKGNTSDEKYESLKKLRLPVFYETVRKEDPDAYFYVYGEITEKWSNALTLKLDTQRMIEAWGEYAYIVTDEADEWCVGDEIEVRFTEVRLPKDTSKYVYVMADEVMPLLLAEKPIIYFYPEIPTVCSVKLTLNGSLTCTYPDYGKGWDNFTAYPDGTLIFPDGKQYYALYWEGVQHGEWDTSEGFCVRGEDTASFLEWALSAQGLTPREANEFIVYWLPRMQENEYNVISFQADAYTENAVLDVSPAPDTLIRVFMTYYPSDVAVDIAPQSFSTVTRQGFTVVEWGGSEIAKP